VDLSVTHAHSVAESPGGPTRSLRIALISTPHESTPPLAYGSINRIVADLTHELVLRGHEVEVFATGDSTAGGTLRAVYDAPGEQFYDVSRDWMHALHSLRQVRDVDVVHNHNLFSGVALAFLAQARTYLTTAHYYTHRDQHLLSLAGLPSVGHSVVAQSEAQQRRMSWLHPVAVIPPGIRPDLYGFDAHHDGYLLVLGVVGEHKGVREAIDVARTCGYPLIIAGPVPPWCERYYLQQIVPELHGRIQYIGEVGGEERLRLLQRARGLLMLSKAPETFGLSCVEAMVSGTPTVVSGRGALPEIVQHGVTGFVADGHLEWCKAVDALGTIRPEACRAHVEQKYTAAHMADRYLAVYDWLLQREGHGPTTATRSAGPENEEAWR
jgi:glycosyltransferase involved in cell wall biosynthesis